MNSTELNIFKLFIFMTGAAFFGCFACFDKNRQILRKYFFHITKSSLKSLFCSIKKSREATTKTSTEHNKNTKDNNNDIVEEFISSIPVIINNTTTSVSPVENEVDNPNFLEEIQKGEQLITNGNYEDGIKHFLNALSVCDQPQILLDAFEKELPEEAYEMLLKQVQPTSNNTTINNITQKLNNREFNNTDTIGKNYETFNEYNGIKNIFANYYSGMIASIYSTNKKNSIYSSSNTARKLYYEEHNQVTMDYLKYIKEIYFGKSLIFDGQYDAGIMLIVNTIINSSCPNDLYNIVKEILTPQELNEMEKIICKKYENDNLNLKAAIKDDHDEIINSTTKSVKRTNSLRAIKSYNKFNNNINNDNDSLNVIPYHQQNQGQQQQEQQQQQKQYYWVEENQIFETRCSLKKLIVAPFI